MSTLHASLPLQAQQNESIILGETIGSMQMGEEIEYNFATQLGAIYNFYLHDDDPFDLHHGFEIITSKTSYNGYPLGNHVTTWALNLTGDGTPWVVRIYRTGTNTEQLTFSLQIFWVDAPYEFQWQNSRYLRGPDQLWDLYVGTPLWIKFRIGSEIKYSLEFFNTYLMDLDENGEIDVQWSIYEYDNINQEIHLLNSTSGLGDSLSFSGKDGIYLFKIYSYEGVKSDEMMGSFSVDLNEFDVLNGIESGNTLPTIFGDDNMGYSLEWGVYSLYFSYQHFLESYSYEDIEAGENEDQIL